MKVLKLTTANFVEELERTRNGHRKILESLEATRKDQCYKVSAHIAFLSKLYEFVG